VGGDEEKKKKDYFPWEDPSLLRTLRKGVMGIEEGSFSYGFMGTRKIERKKTRGGIIHGRMFF